MSLLLYVAFEALAIAVIFGLSTDVRAAAMGFGARSPAPARCSASGAKSQGV